MASIVILRNPLDPGSREITRHDAGTAVIDWLQREYPAGFGMPVRFYVNGEEKPLDDLDYRLEEDDVAVIALMPAEPVSLSTLAIGLLISIVLSAATYFAMQAFMPKEAGKAKGEKYSTFDIGSDQNAAAIGDPIPVIYGTVLTTPDYVAQPYTWFNWSQAKFDELYLGTQYLDLILCVGQGYIDVSDVYVGDTDTTTITPGIVSWRSFTPDQHQSSMGVISNAMGAGFHENVVTSAEVSNQEFVDLNDFAGPFASCKPGGRGSTLQVDVIFPGGLTNPTADGDINGRSTSFAITYYEIDDNDNPIGVNQVLLINCSTSNSVSISGPNVSAVSTNPASPTNRTVLSGPLRRSYKFSTGKSGRWAVRIHKTTSAPNSKAGSDRFIWTALKHYLDYQPGQVYGNVTLLALRIKASNGVGSDASVRVRVKATRRLSPPGGGLVVPTVSAPDAFADVYTNTVYGADRPASELDISTLTALRSKWAGYSFNHVFKDRTTVWEALRTITTPFGAEPLPVGAVMSVAQDGVKNIRAMLFTDANIVDGTMNVTYSFDEEGAADGVEIEYLDPKDFRQVFTTYPAGAVQPGKFTLPGVTDATHAAQYARLTWQRQQLQRKKITFDTELEGLILVMGDRIGVSHNVPKWGDGGLVISTVGTNQVNVDHDLDWSGGASKYILLRRRDGSVTDPIMVTKGFDAHNVVLQQAMPLTPDFDNDYEYTNFAFGEATTLVRDFIVTSVRPNGENTVTVEAMNYAPSIFAGAMSYMVT